MPSALPFICDGSHEGYPGHPEVELALLRMYRATGDKLCLELAEHFLNIRGADTAFYEKEVAKRTWKVWGADPTDHAYQQSQCPVRELDEATGHSVRAVYLYTAMADLASETDDQELKKACDRLWKSITERRMYVTGGIGSTFLGEAFTKDYDLPNDTAYAETCASIGLMFFASRMLENEVKGTYGDVMERAFYNTVLAGMQLDGRRFFYVNPLEVVPGIAGEAVTHKHVIPQRPTWYACACCPPNVARLITSIGKYAYGENGNTAYCHLYVAGDTKFENGLELNCVTEYPYAFTIRYEIRKGGKELAVRVPGWSSSVTVRRGTDAGSWRRYLTKSRRATSIWEPLRRERSLSSSWMTPRNFSMLPRKYRISRAVWLSREVRWSTALRGRTITEISCLWPSTIRNRQKRKLLTRSS